MRPRAALRSELYRVLDGQLSVDVYVQKVSEGKSPGELVMIEAPSTPARGDIKEDTGHEVAQTIRIHTRAPKGQADLSRRDELAAQVISALDAATIDPDDHRVVDWPEEPHDDDPVSYEVSGSEQAHDILLTYRLYTQIKATI